MWTHGRTPARVPSYKLTLWAFGSGELKSKILFCYTEMAYTDLLRQLGNFNWGPGWCNKGTQAGDNVSRAMAMTYRLSQQCRALRRVWWMNSHSPLFHGGGGPWLQMTDRAYTQPYSTHRFAANKIINNAFKLTYIGIEILFFVEYYITIQHKPCRAFISTNICKTTKVKKQYHSIQHKTYTSKI